MLTLFRILLVFLFFSPAPLMACGPKVKIVKKPEGLLENTSGPHYHPTAKDRQEWKSILNWCDECDDRTRPYLERFGDDDGTNGGIFIYPIADNQYIVDVKCEMTMQQSEHIYYKVVVRNGMIESRLLNLEQFYHAEYGEDTLVKGVKDPKGEFVKFTDTVAYGLTTIPDKKSSLIIIERRYRGAGGCGLYTVYDVSGDCPKLLEFRARVECTADSPPPETWKLFPAEQRAKWRTVPNPSRHDWKSSSTSPACTE